MNKIVYSLGMCLAFIAGMFWHSHVYAQDDVPILSITYNEVMYFKIEGNLMMILISDRESCSTNQHFLIITTRTGEAESACWSETNNSITLHWSDGSAPTTLPKTEFKLGGFWRSA